MKNKRLCVVVPFRDRESHLTEFLPSMHKYLTDQEIDYTILIVEQEPGKPFNRAKLLNVGFAYDISYDYYCFHDVDMLPVETDYDYCDRPTHLAARAEQFGYKLPYEGYFGGVTLFDKESFVKVNGYANEYWGWGAEDDDMFSRCNRMGIKPGRKDGKYISLSHDRNIIQQEYQQNVDKLRNFEASFNGYEFTEGLSNLHYQVNSVVEKSDRYIRINVSI